MTRRNVRASTLTKGKGVTLELTPAQQTATMLLNEARNTTLDLLRDDMMAPQTIALEVFPFVRRAARVLNKQYTPQEKGDVIEKFQTAMTYYSKVSGLKAITVLDLTTAPEQTMIMKALR